MAGLPALGEGIPGIAVAQLDVIEERTGLRLAGLDAPQHESGVEPGDIGRLGDILAGENPLIANLFKHSLKIFLHLFVGKHADIVVRTIIALN